MNIKSVLIVTGLLVLSGCSKHSLSHSSSTSYTSHEKIMGLYVEVEREVRTKEQCIKVAENFAYIDVQGFILNTLKNRVNNDPFLTVSDVLQEPKLKNLEDALLVKNKDIYFNSCWAAQQKLMSTHP